MSLARRSLPLGFETSQQLLPTMTMTPLRKKEKEKIEKELLEWSDGNKKDVIYQIGYDLFLAKDEVKRAQAFRQLNRLISDLEAE
jgi:hypothetical protein